MQVLLHQIAPRCSDMILHLTATFRTCTGFRRQQWMLSFGDATLRNSRDPGDITGSDSMA